ncbi:hypothetical protein AM231_24205 [Paenibacillus solani]|uniref:Signal transduction histidine kinase n=1 Tax=Paenibacillus solani TaxID=1705565 RepID=A0A0M1N0U8_9BACL|nr:hypothetical protein AM231_24205 [Paenibacillus solani]
MVIIIALLFLIAGILFIVKSKKDNKNKRLFRWIGISLIIMTIFFLVFGTLQIMDVQSHKVGH